MADKCYTCDEEGEHMLSYHRKHTAWWGWYCTSCFIKKLRGMATAWSKKKEK